MVRYVCPHKAVPAPAPSPRAVEGWASQGRDRREGTRVVERIQYTPYQHDYPGKPHQVNQQPWPLTQPPEGFVPIECGDTKHDSTARYGQVRPTVWQLGLGNTKVFTNLHHQRPKRLTVLVDCSGSMESACFPINLYPARLTVVHLILAGLWQLTPLPRIYAFGSSFTECVVGELAPNTYPAVDCVHYGNLDCAALLWVGQRLSASDTLVVLSDGDPADPVPPGCSPPQHTRRVVRQLLARGVGVASIVLGLVDSDRIYPDTVKFCPATPADLANVGPFIRQRICGG